MTVEIISGLALKIKEFIGKTLAATSLFDTGGPQTVPKATFTKTWQDFWKNISNKYNKSRFLGLPKKFPSLPF